MFFNTQGLQNYFDKASFLYMHFRWKRKIYKEKYRMFAGDSQRLCTIKASFSYERDRYKHVLLNF